VVGLGRLGQRQQGPDHPLHLVLVRPAAATDGLLHGLRRVRIAGNSGQPGRQHERPARLPDGERAAHVLPEEEVLHSHRLGLVALDKLDHVVVDAGKALLQRVTRARDHHPAVERGQGAPAGQDHPVAGVGCAWIDAEDDHHPSDSAYGRGRLRVP
jgi:hypothetical protein